MKKMSHDAIVYRLPPCKKYPKGMRVYKSNDPEENDSIFGQMVCEVKDGKMWFTKQLLTKEK